VSKENEKKGPSRAQLTRALEKRDMRIKYLEAELARFTRGDVERREGEHWYELVDLLDPNQIRALPKSPLGATYVMGMIGNMTILEYPAGTDPNDVRQFMDMLKQQGVPPTLAVQAGVRFVRLRSITAEVEQQLDAEVSRERTEREQAAGAGARGVGPELHGNGLGGGVPGDIADPGRGGDPHGAGASGGEAVGGG